MNDHDSLKQDISSLINYYQALIISEKYSADYYDTIFHIALLGQAIYDYACEIGDQYDIEGRLCS